MRKELKTIGNCELCQNKPCLIGCPLDNDIPSFIECLKKDDIEGAFKVLEKTTVLMPICGRICPHFKQCEGSCIKKDTKKRVEIGLLEAFVGDSFLNSDLSYNVTNKMSNYKVAVIGSGPASLTCAAFLRKEGIDVTIYEKYDYLGGLLSHGIPTFRLPKEIVDNTIKKILDMGINIKYKKELGKNLDFKKLVKKYDAVFLGIGANKSNKMRIIGENLKGVFGGNEFLEKKKKIDFTGKIVYVAGGGNVSMDVARTIARLNPKKVVVVYRRDEKNMSADIKEVEAAMEDGIEFVFNTNITKIIGEDKVQNVELTKGNKKRILRADYVFESIGSHPARLVKSLGLDLNDKGRIIITKDSQTSNEKVFAGGDVAGIPSTVAWASRSGRNAAVGIINYLRNY